MSKTILVVDDEKEICTVLSDNLSQEGYRVFTANSGKTALELVKKEKPDLVLLDIRMPEMDGIEVLRRIKKMKKEIVVIMLTAYGTLETARKAMKLGAYDYITKPFDLFSLKSIVKEGLKRLKETAKRGKR
jgi:DNA-binding NtrC family response regulator